MPEPAEDRMLKTCPGCPGLPGQGPQDPELVLSRLIAASAAVESLACDLVGQVPAARVLRILLLTQDMERLVQDLQTILHSPAGKNVFPAFQGIVRTPLPH